MKVVVGLGNPGRKYDGTRHNVGFAVIDGWPQAPASAGSAAAFRPRSPSAREDDEKVLLVKPETFMNLSGRRVRQVIDFYQLALADLLVVCDDINLPLGKLRFRARGRTAATTACATSRTTWARPNIRGCGSASMPRGEDDMVGPRARPVPARGAAAIEDALSLAAQAVGRLGRAGHQTLHESVQ